MKGIQDCRQPATNLKVIRVYYLVASASGRRGCESLFPIRCGVGAFLCISHAFRRLGWQSARCAGAGKLSTQASATQDSCKVGSCGNYTIRRNSTRTCPVAVLVAFDSLARRSITFTRCDVLTGQMAAFQTCGASHHSQCRFAIGDLLKVWLAGTSIRT